LTRRRSESSTVARPGAAVAAEEQRELQALVPLLANHFKRAHADMPPGLRAVFDAAGRLIYHGRIDNLYEDFGHARKAATSHELVNAIQAAISGKNLPATPTPAIGCYISDLE